MEANTALQNVIVAPSLSKAAQSTLAESLVSQVVEGSVDPMQAFIQIKAIAEVCKQFLDNPEILNRTRTAVAKSGKLAPTFNGAKVSLSTTTRYNYESCMDPEYAELIRQKEIIADKIKAREMFLKSIDDSIDIVDKATGKPITIYQPSMTQSPTLRVLFAKQ